MKKVVLLICFLSVSVWGYSQRTTIQGLDSSGKVNNINILSQLPFYFNDINLGVVTKVKKENNTFHVSFDIDSVGIVEIGPDAYLSNTQIIFVTKGDSVNFSVVANVGKGYHINFTGDNSPHYNYFRLLSQKFPYKSIPRYVKDSPFELFKDSLSAFYERQRSFLNDYIEHYKVSRSFINYANASITSEYAYKLFESIISNPDIISEEEANELFNNTPISTNLLVNACRVALQYKYISRYMLQQSLEQIYLNIQNNTNGEIEEFLTSALIGIYALKGDGSLAESLNEIINSTQGKISNSEYAEYINKAKDYLNILNKPISDYVLSNTYLRSYNDTTSKITLRELLAKYDKKAIYLDIWASWCGACRIDIKNSHSAKEFLMSKDIAYVYLSIDKDEKLWLNAAKEDGITENQYLVCDNKSSPLLNYFNIQLIPRYIMLDTEHQVKYSNAPRPTEYFRKTLEEAVSNLNIK